MSGGAAALVVIGFIAVIAATVFFTRLYFQWRFRAWQQARKEERSTLRPAPLCPWGDYVRSVRTTLNIGPDGRLRIEQPPGT